MEIEVEDSIDLTLFRPDSLYQNLETLFRIASHYPLEDGRFSDDLNDLIDLEIAFVSCETVMHVDAVLERFSEHKKEQAKKNIRRIK